MMYSYVKEINVEQLSDEIRASSITVAFDYIAVSGTTVDIYFKASLSSAEATVLDSLVANHVAQAIVVPNVPVEIKSQVAPHPFADPCFRTKWDASPDIVSAEASQTVVMDFIPSEERYAHGGSIVFDGVKVGDWLEAEIRDDAGVIPEAYRASLCEAWPLVAKYIFKHYLPPGQGFRELNTYPLNAKITAGLNLRVVIHTTSEVGTRKFATNYLLTKRLPK